MKCSLKITVTLHNPVFLVGETSSNDIEDGFIPGVETAEAKISIPREVVERSDHEIVRMASLLFRNMSELLPERLEGNNTDGYVAFCEIEWPIHVDLYYPIPTPPATHACIHNISRQ